jgi:lipopolysaccharide biosynthesis protein
MAENDSRTKQLRDALDAARAQIAAQEEELAALRRELDLGRSLLAEKDAAVQALQGSLSWRITAPLRLLRKLVTAPFRRPVVTRAAPAPVAADDMVAAAPKTCIFAHHDPEATVSGHVLELLRGISSAGYAILFVTTAGGLPEDLRRRLDALCVRVFTRENRGRDFGAWQFGLNRLEGLETLDWLLLANDSVFGPLFDLSETTSRMEASGADFWGITDSYQGRWHLQSYFLCLGGAVVRAEAFRAVLAKDFAGLTKQQIIDEGEIGLSQALVAAGYRGAAYCPYEALDAGRRDFSRNPMHHYWDKLITEARCPFLKIELLRDNPFEVPNVGRYREVLATVSGYDLDLIEAHLKRAPGSRPGVGPGPSIAP